MKTLILAALILAGCAPRTEEAKVYGRDGNGCTTTAVTGGALIKCGDTTTLVKDGTAGLPPGAEIVYIYDPCGKSPNVFNNEIVFISNVGNVYAYFEDNAANTPYTSQTRRMSYLTPGRYRTTDSITHYCSFTVQPTSAYPNVITNEVQY